MPGIKGHGGIADGRVDARRCGGGGGGRQEAIGEARATIGGGGEPDIGSATTEDAAHLEGGHERTASGKGIWLDFRFVLAGAVGKRVAAELNELDSGKGEQSGRAGEQQGEGERDKGAGWSSKLRNTR
ncbi:MAG TPA: hypothetical protein VFK47_17785 [Ktedonobacteraceae bacterium]|nr:hypothetical protein [Ktedonobacteraceae bacterium]